MQPRPLETENRMLRAVGADELRVSLGRAVSEITETPMTGTLLSRSMERFRARSEVFSEEEQLELLNLEQQQADLEYDLALETDPLVRERLTSQLDDIYSQNKTARNSMVERAIEDSRLMDPKDLNEMYEGIVSFTEPTSPEEAKLLAQGKKEEIIRNAIISRSPSGFIPGAAKFGAGMIAMATDPVEVATMFIPIVGPVGRAASVARFGAVKGRAAVGAVEGVGGALLTEPLFYGLSKSQQLDYSMSEALFNVGAGVFLGGGLGTIAGVFSRAGQSKVDVRSVIDTVDLEESVKADLKAVSLPKPKIMTEAEAIAKANAAVKQTRKMYGLTGNKVTYETALRQFVTDQGVSVSVVQPKAVGRPQTLSQFVGRRGGINDQDPVFRGELKNFDTRAVAGYVNKKGTIVSGISNPKSQSNLDDMADIAFQEGYLPERSPDALVAALREEAAGNFTFAKQDMEQAQNWRDYHRAANDFEREVAHRADIRAELEEYQITNVTDEEIALISDRMASNGEDAADAYDYVVMKINNVKAEMLASHAVDLTSDPLADFQASVRFDAVTDDIELDDTILREEAIIAQMREDGELTKYHVEQLDEIDRIDAQAQAYVEVTEAVTVCVARS